MEVRRAEYDLAVVGGGPAGSSAAITAARNGASVVLFDISEFPRQKVCGEFVSAESLGLLQELLRESEEASEVLRDAPVIARARILASGRTAETGIEPPGLSIPRSLLDLLLWECAQQAGVFARSKCEVLSINRRGSFTLATAQGEFSANAVILGTGRWSRFSDSAAVGAGPKWIGIKAHYRERNPAQSTDLYFFENGYCGVQQVTSDAVNVCALVRSDSATTLEAVFRRSPQLQARAEGVGTYHRSRDYRAGAVSQTNLLTRQHAFGGGRRRIHRPLRRRWDLTRAAQRAGRGRVFASVSARPRITSDRRCELRDCVRARIRSADCGVNACSEIGLFARHRSPSRVATATHSRGAAVRDQENAGRVRAKLFALPNNQHVP